MLRAVCSRWLDLDDTMAAWNSFCSLLSSSLATSDCLEAGRLEELLSTTSALLTCRNWLGWSICLVVLLPATIWDVTRAPLTSLAEVCALLCSTIRLLCCMFTCASDCVGRLGAVLLSVSWEDRRDSALSTSDRTAGMGAVQLLAL